MLLAATPVGYRSGGQGYTKAALRSHACLAQSAADIGRALATRQDFPLTRFSGAAFIGA